MPLTPRRSKRWRTVPLSAGARAPLVALVLVALGCASDPGVRRDGLPIGASSSRDDVVSFTFDSLDERPVRSDAFRGKPTVLAFVATWDLSSQAQVDFLVPMHAHDGARVNYALVALQEPKDRELVEAFRGGLHVDFPVALGDRESIAGGGPLGDVHNVPTLLVLDAQGHVVWKRVGLARSHEVRAVLKNLGRGRGGPDAETTPAGSAEEWNAR